MFLTQLDDSVKFCVLSWDLLTLRTCLISQCAYIKVHSVCYKFLTLTNAEHHISPVSFRIIPLL